MTTWVCSCGSPQRESQWSYAVAAIPPHADLCNRSIPGCYTRAGGGNLPLQERNDLRNGRMVSFDQHLLGAGVGNAPQHRDRLRHREGEVIARNRPVLALLGLLSLDPRHLDIALLATQPRVEFGDSRGDPVSNGLVLRKRPAQLIASERVTTLPEQQRELVLTDSRAGSEFTVTEGVNPAPEPVARRGSCLLVVPRQRQILIPVASAHHAHRNRHKAQVRTEPPSICQTFRRATPKS